MAVEDYILDPALAGGVAGILALGAVIVMMILVFAIALYIYSALTMMATAKRLNVKDPWLAWVPVGNLVLLSRMAKMPWWPVLLLLGTLIPVLGVLCAIAFMVFQVIWLWKVCEARNKEGWLAVITVVPLVGWIWSLVLWGMLAWGE